MSRKVRVVVMMGGPSSEHAVSLASGAQVLQALQSTHEFDVSALVISRTGQWQMTSSVPGILPEPGEAAGGPMPRDEAIRGVGLLRDVDMVFLAFHGPFGEDGTLQGFMEALSIPYTGSGPLASALAMDKAKAKELFRCYGLKTPDDLHFRSKLIRASLTNAIQTVEANFTYPVVVKPNLGGSSLGVSIANHMMELEQALITAARFDTDVLVEERLEGREVTCAVLEEMDGDARALPVIEIVPKRGPFFDFASKYEDGGSEEICPANLTPDETRAVQQAALVAHEALGCRGFSRTDMFLTESGPVVLEVNTIPGLTPNSLMPKAAKAAGLSFAELVSHVVKVALART
ncbi:MAG: D-alanine--D-alanine ligase [Sulfobacillus acidophilus]|uniref:D-alanine--D-alanine ligase n=1 Tax=Sulfobacillus acidophilus TaxID=53633 RepID=A0A2T2WE97_9FIRM|nr:MAG: D-alanine--D-alanine ligase [Sulfobacillus acidophilus]